MNDGDDISIVRISTSTDINLYWTQYPTWDPSRGGPIGQNREKSSKNTHHEHRYLIPARTNLSIVVVSHFYQQEPNIENVLAIQRNCSEKLVSDWLKLARGGRCQLGTELN